MQNRPLPALQPQQTVALTPGQAAEIVVGVGVVSILLSFTAYFLVVRMKKKKERDSYLDEKDFARSPVKLPSRLSSTLWTGNGVTIKFNPPKSSDAGASSRSALRRPENFPVASNYSKKREREPSQIVIPEIDDSTGNPLSLPRAPSPLSLRFTKQVDIFSDRSPSQGFTWPLGFSTINEIDPTPVAPPAPESAQTFPHLSAMLTPRKRFETTVTVSLLPRGPSFEEATPGELFVDPLDEPIEETSLEQMVGLHMKQSSWEQIEDLNWDLILEEPHNAPMLNPEEPIPRHVDGSSEEPLEQPIEDIDKSLKDSTETPIEKRPNESTVEQLLPQQLTTLPVLEDFALLQEDKQTPRIPQIDTLLRLAVQQNEVIGSEPLFESDFRAPDVEVEQVMLPLPPREHSPVREISPSRRETVSPATTEEQRERTLSPLRRNPIIYLASAETKILSPTPDQSVAIEQRKPSPPQPTLISKRKISPRRNPQIRNINSMLAEYETGFNLEMLTDEAGADDREKRGRSMIRTSDIIDSRLLGRAHKKEEEKATEQVGIEERERTLRKNPVDPAMTPTEQRDRMLSPLRRNPSTRKRKSRTPSPPPFPNSSRSIPTAIISRQDSPVGHNLQLPVISSLPASDPKTGPTSETASRPTGNSQFSQTLSKFQTLASQNPKDAITASTEVTQRAIAGIFVPGSLREEAVRSLSKSRERVRSRVGGSLPRNASSPVGMASDLRDRSLSPLRRPFPN